MAARLRQDFEAFASNPQNARNIDLRKIQGQKNVYRIRCGNHRILFVREKGSLTAFAANDRKDVY